MPFHVVGIEKAQIIPSPQNFLEKFFVQKIWADLLTIWDNPWAVDTEMNLQIPQKNKSHVHRDCIHNEHGL